MKFKVAKEIFEKFPTYMVGVVVARGLDNSSQNNKLQQQLAEAVTAVKGRYTPSDMDDEPLVKRWREAFSELGWSKDIKSSIDALLTRITEGKDLPFINNAVALGNLIALKHILPVGAHDLGRLEGDFAVRLSKPEELFTPMGNDVPEEIVEGEIVYADGQEIRTRRWVWRQGDKAKIFADSKDIFFPVDGFSDLNGAEVIAARDELAKLIEQLFGVTTQTYLVNKDNPETPEFESETTHKPSLEVQRKLNLITRNLEETLTESELKLLLESGTPLKHYIGFEISGKVHLGTGLVCMQKIKDLCDAGAEVTVFLADWHGWINNKLDGTLETANKLARSYFEEGLKAGYLCLGGNPDDIKFILGSELYEQNPNLYWATVIKVGKATTISRMMRSTDIMGRQSGEASNAATLMYPAMQAADLFTMERNIIHAGTDQRNVHVIARDVAKDLGLKKPVAIHHHLIMGLKPLGDNDDPELAKKAANVGNLSYEEKAELITSLKMSKSKPNSAIFITDSPEDIRKKINSAYAPEGVVEFNPLLDWAKYLVFYEENSSLTVSRKPEHGGDMTYSSYSQLENDYKDKRLHPMDLKAALAEWLIKKLEPARKYFEEPKRKAALEEIERLTARG